MIVKQYEVTEQCGASVDRGPGHPYVGVCPNEARCTAIDTTSGQAVRRCTIHVPVGALSVSDDKLRDLLIGLSALLDAPIVDYGSARVAELRQDLRGIIGRAHALHGEIR